MAANKALNSCKKTALEILILLWRDNFSIGMLANGIKNQIKLYFRANVTHKALF